MNRYSVLFKLLSKLEVHLLELKNCGAGSPGKPGFAANNTCADGGGSNSDSKTNPKQKPSKKPTSKPSSKTSPKGASYSKQHDEWISTLNKNEKDAFKHWTGDNYRKIKDCQYKNIGCKEKFKTVLSDLEKAHAKAPKFKGSVYRGLSFGRDDHRDNYLATIIKNGGFQQRGFSSTTTNKKIASEFAADSSSGLLMEIRQRSGVDIKKLSQVPHEDEVLMKQSFLKFVTVKKTKGGGPMVIVMEEK